MSIFLMLLAPALTAQSRGTLIYVSFSPSETTPNPQLESAIETAFIETGEKNNYDVVRTGSLEEALDLFKGKNSFSAILTGQYLIKGENISLFGQLHHADNGELYDAFHEAPFQVSFSDLELDAEEMQTTDEETISRFVQIAYSHIRTNPRQYEKRSNLEASYLYTPVSKTHPYEIVSREESSNSSEQVFAFLEEQDSISIVSRRIGSQEQESTARTSAVVSVFTRSFIEQSGARNLADLLNLVPGVTVSYDQFGSYKVAFRGIRSRSGVLLLLDGHKLNNFYDGSTFLDIRADVIEKIEIIRGPGSSVHGANAFVGVINVTTRQNTEDSTRFSGKAGSFHTLELSGSNATTIKDYQLQVKGQVYQSDRQSFHIPYDSTCQMRKYDAGLCQATTIPLPENKNIRTNDYKRQYNAFLSVEKPESWYGDVKFFQEEKGPNMGEVNQVTPDSTLRFSRILVDAGNQTIQITSEFLFQFKVYGDFARHSDDIQVERADLLSHPGEDARKKIMYDYFTYGTEGIFQYSPWKNNTLNLGVQAEVDTVSGYAIEKNYIGSDTSTLFSELADYDHLKKNQNRSRTVSGIFVQDIWTVFSRIDITLGVRYDHYSDFGSTINPKSGVVFEALRSPAYGTLYIKGLYGTAFRAPTFQELYDQTQLYQISGVIGNEELKPEKITSYEISSDYQSPWKPLRLVANGFYNEITDNILGTSESGILPGENDTYVNLRGIDTYGAEGEVLLRFSEQNSFFANISWFRSVSHGGFREYEDVDVDTYLIDIPQLRVNAGHFFPFWNKRIILYDSLEYLSNRAANYRFAGETRPKDRFDIPELLRWNLSVSTTKAMHEKVRFAFSVYNVLNAEWYDDANFSENTFAERRVPVEGRYIETAVRIEL